MTRRSFEDEEPTLPEKPQGVKPMGETHKILAKSGSAIIALLMWASIKNNLKETNHENISTMQLQAGEHGKAIMIDTIPDSMRTKIVGAITGKKETKSTVIINPPGQEPAVQVMTPEVTITADDTGKVESIVPKEDTKEKPLTEEEAKRTVDEAVKDAFNTTLPKDDQVKPIKIPEENK